MIALGIESTAHTFSIGIVDENGKIYSNERVIYKTEKGGIHPREAAELHSREAINVLNNSIFKAGFIYKKDEKIEIVDALYEVNRILDGSVIRYHEEPWNRYRYVLYKNNIKIWVENNKIVSNDKVVEEKINKELSNIEFTRKIDLISFSAGPGLYPTLLQGYFLANLLSNKLNIPKVGVNHLVAHIEIAKMYNNFKDPVVLLVSGANTMVLAYEGNRYRIFGETLDIGVGNFLDKVGRIFNLGFPAGPKLEELAKNGKELIELPYTVKGMDIQLGGLYTYIKKIANKYRLEDIAFSIQEYVFSMLAEISERAIAHLNKKEFAVTGGVAVNKRLQEILRKMCEERGVKFGSVPIDLGNDNGAMIAWTGILWYKNKIKGLDGINPYWRPESIEILKTD